MPAILNLLNRLLSNLPHWQVMLLALILIAVLGAIDHITGYEVSFSFFYLIPIVLTTWYIGRWLGSVTCLLSAIVWLTVDFTSGHMYSQAWMPYWNSIVRFMFFILVSHLLSVVKIHLLMERQLARTDSLTGLMNLYSYREQIDLLFKNAVRHHFPITIGYIDLDGFKPINDSLGHVEGDSVLKAVGSVLKRSTRDGDIHARLGGDEFGVVLANTDMPGAKVFFDRLDEKLQAAMKSSGWKVGFSIGVAVFHKELPAIDEALRWADSLMYSAKHSGGNKLNYQEYNSQSSGII